MPNFQETIFDAEYARAYATINGFERIVFIESEGDRRFWSQLFEQANMNGCDFAYTCMNDKSKRGKNQYKPYLTKANQYAIIALDSDYDYVAPNHGDCNLEDCGQFVLQTYAYARESIVYNAQSIEYGLSELYFYERRQVEFNQFAIQLSQRIYTFLVTFLYSLEHYGDTEQLITKRQFTDILKELDLPQAFVNAEHWTSINNNLQRETQKLHDTLIERGEAGIESFKQVLANKGLNANSCYRFIDAHFWHLSVVKPIVRQWLNGLKQQEQNRIRAEFSGQQIQNKINEMQNHFRENCSFDTIVNQPQQYHQDDVFQRILGDIQELNR